MAKGLKASARKFDPFLHARKHRTEAGMIRYILASFPRGVRFDIVTTNSGELTAVFPYPGNPHYTRSQIAERGYYAVNV